MLIVDDEEMTRQGLVRLLAGSQLGLEVVGEADDGATALPLLEKLRPDILFTDVKMARMDGLALAKHARERYPDLEIVFLSGYSEVDYVRSAMRVGAFDYILKPVNFEELEQCFHRVIQRLEEKRRSRENMQKLQDWIHAELPVMQERFLLSVLKGQAPSGERLQAQLEKLQLPKDRPFSTAAMILDPDEGALDSCKAFRNDWPLLSVALKNICNEIVQEQFQGLSIDDPFASKRLVLVLFLYEEGDPSEALMRLGEQIKAVVKKYLELRVSLGVGSVVDSLQRLKESYTLASQALKHRLYLGGEMVIPYNLSLAPEGDPSEEKLTSGSLRSLLLEEDEGKWKAWVDEQFSHLVRLRSTDITFYRNVISRYIFEVYGVLREQMGEGEEGTLSQQSILDQLFHSETLEQMRELLLQYGSNVRDLIRLKNDSATIGMIQQVQKTIRERYSENLTINELAAQVYLTPTYLCLLFRQVTGTTINRYLTNVRMEKAKELLMDLSNKLYDVSYAVGYMNPSYFSRQFKKYVGCLPSEYRNRRMSRE